jgi:hypothetical protein
MAYTPAIPKVNKKPAKVLPSDRLNFLRQKEVLKAFATAFEASGGSPVTNDDAGKLIKMAGATVVVTNAFFRDVGFIITAEEGGFRVSQPVMDYLKACEWDEKTAGIKLAPLLKDTWFAQQLIPRLKMGNLDQNEALQILAEAGGTSKDYETQLERLIDFLEFAGFIVVEGSTLKINAGKNASSAGKKDSGTDDPDKKKKNDPPGENRSLPIPLDARTGRAATLEFPTDLKDDEVGKILEFIKLSFDYNESKDVQI